MSSHIFKNALWLTGGEIIGRLLRAGLIIYAARVLGVTDWGIFSYILGLSALFTIVADVGIGAVLTRELVAYPNKQEQYFFTSLYIKIGLVMLSSLLLLGASPFITNLSLPTSLLIVAALLVISDSLRTFAFSITRAIEKMHVEAITNIITQLSITVLGITALYYHASLTTLGSTYVIGSTLGLGIALWNIRSWLKKIRFAFDRKLAKKIITIAWPFALLGLLGAITLNTDIIMLGWMQSAENIGYYSVAQKIILVLYVIPTLFATAAFPSWTRLAGKDQQAFGNLLVRILKIVFLIGIPITIGGIIIGYEMIETLFGAQYLPAVASFRILLISLLINFPTTIVGNALFAYNKQKQFIIYAGLGAICNVIFNYLLIPIWGIEGAAISTVMTQMISNGFIWYIMKKTNPFSLKNQLNKILMSAILMGIIIGGMHFIYDMSFYLILIIGILIYPLILFLFKEPALQDIIGVMQLKSKKSEL